jgi:hypothetical protein
MTFKRSLGVCLCATLGIAVIARSASATPISVNFTAEVATIQDVNGSLPTIAVGTLLSGRYEFDSDALDTDSSSTAALYDILSFSIFGPGGFSDSTTSQFLRVFNNEPGIGDENLTFGFLGPSGSGGVMSLLLQSTVDLSVLTSTALPTEALSLSQFPIRSLSYALIEPGQRVATVGATLTSLSVPEPTSLALLGVGLLSLVARRYQSHRS